VWQQHLLHQRYKARTLIGGINNGSWRAGILIGISSWRQSTLLAASYINRQASSADFCS